MVWRPAVISRWRRDRYRWTGCDSAWAGILAAGVLLAVLQGPAVGTTAEPGNEEEAPVAGGARTMIAQAPKDARGPSPFSLPGSDSSAPIHIDADVLEFDAQEDVAIFRGDVVTTQDDVVMRSSTLRVTFAPSEGGVGSLERFQTVVAEGDVRITKGTRVARGHRAEFSEADRTIVLTGDAVLHEGANEVHGERVIVYLDEERGVVEGTTSRVKAILVPDKKHRGPAVAEHNGDAEAPEGSPIDHAGPPDSDQDP